MSFAAVLERLAKLENPYPGLPPFQPSQSHLFFGRDQQVLDLCDRLARNRFVAVLGLSGSGKSSVVLAGLVPALERGRLLEPGRSWRIARCRPSGVPFSNLAHALGCEVAALRATSHGLIDFAAAHLDPERALLVVVDQFEELFRYKDLAFQSTPDSSSASEASAFIGLLLAASRSPLPIYVVITMRTDYLGDCAEFPEFPEALNESQYLVPRLTREQRRQAIVGPLGQVQISSALVDRILNDAGDEADELPILQHALMRTWAHWRDLSPENDRPISLDDYLAIGGFAGALNQHADELLGAPAVVANPKFVEIVFKRLTARGRGNRERRDPARLSELWALCNAVTPEKQQRVNEVLNVFRKGEAAFLISAGAELKSDSYIDIAHESLIQNWNILAKEWLPAEVKDAKTLLELLDRARGWQNKTRDLLTGLDLSSALQWKSRINPAPEWSEHYVGAGAIAEIDSFLNASHQKFEEDEQERLENFERQLTTEKELRESAERREELVRSSARRTKIFSYVLIALFLGAVGLALLAYRATLQARAQQKVAESRELAAKAESLIFQDNRVEALAVATRAFSVEKTVQSREAIAHAIASESARLEGHAYAVYNAAFSPDGQRVVTASWDKTARVWNAAGGQLITKLEGHSDGVVSAAFSPDGQRVVTASFDKTARVWNAASGQPIVKLKGHADIVNSAAFSPDGQRVVTASVDKTARVWNAASGQLIANLDGHARKVLSAVFSPDGQRILTASEDGIALIFRIVTLDDIDRLLATK